MGHVRGSYSGFIASFYHTDTHTRSRAHTHNIHMCTPHTHPTKPLVGRFCKVFHSEWKVRWCCGTPLLDVQPGAPREGKAPDSYPVPTEEALDRGFHAFCVVSLVFCAVTRERNGDQAVDSCLGGRGGMWNRGGSAYHPSSLGICVADPEVQGHPQSDCSLLYRQSSKCRHIDQCPGGPPIELPTQGRRRHNLKDKDHKMFELEICVETWEAQGLRNCVECSQLSQEKGVNGKVAQLVECLPGPHQALCSMPGTLKNQAQWCIPAASALQR